VRHHERFESFKADLMLLAAIAVVTLAPNVLLLPLVAWARWLRRRPAAPRLAAWAAYALLAVGTFVTTLGAISTLASARTLSLATSDGASTRARALAEGISAGMNSGALVVVIAVVAALWLLFGTWRWHWAVRPPVVEGDPPYR
jgi:hypothetical protein